MSDRRSLRARARGVAREAVEVARDLEGAVDRALSAPRTTRALLRDAHVDCVFDVGAHTGGFARSLRRLGYRGRIVSFEPGRTAFDKLAADAKRDAAWTVVPAAIGERTGAATLHVAGNSVSSSLLQMGATHTAAAPDSAPVAAEEVQTLLFSDALARYAGPSDQVFVKLDVQGYEARILQTMEPLDARVVAFQIELSLVHLYDGDETLEQVIARVRRMGFSPIELIPGFRDPATGALLQLDGLFVRDGVLARRAQGLG